MNEERVTYEGTKVFIGIDVHKKFYVLCAVVEGQVVKRSRIEPVGENLLGLMRKYFEGAEICSCYEGGFSGFGLHRYLVRNGIKNIVVHAASVEVEARNRVKTDKRDSLKLAEQLSAGRLRGIRIPSEEEECRRLLTRTRDQLVCSESRIRNQIRSKFHQFGLFPWQDDRALSRNMVREILKRGVNEELDIAVKSLVSIWEVIGKEKRQVEQSLKDQALKDPLEQMWVQMPGSGFVTARILCNELGDMSQFPNERAVYSFSGLTPWEHSSGENVRRGHISRQGSSRLRHVLVEAAWRAVKKDTELKKAFDRIGARRGKKRAIVAVARKLLGRQRALLKEWRENEITLKQAA